MLNYKNIQDQMIADFICLSLLTLLIISTDSPVVITLCNFANIIIYNDLLTYDLTIQETDIINISIGIILKFIIYICLPIWLALLCLENFIEHILVFILLCIVQYFQIS